MRSRDGNVQTRFKLLEKGPVVVVGRAIGGKIGQGKARVIASIDQMHQIEPGDVLLADELLERFDGFSIGSNDLTQLTLGVDRDSNLVSASFDERNPAVKKLLSEAIAACKCNGKYVGICGQGPSDHPDLAEW